MLTLYYIKGLKMSEKVNFLKDVAKQSIKEFIEAKNSILKDMKAYNNLDDDLNVIDLHLDDMVDYVLNVKHLHLITNIDNTSYPINLLYKFNYTILNHKRLHEPFNYYCEKLLYEIKEIKNELKGLNNVLR